MAAVGRDWRALRDWNFDFGRDRDGTNLKKQFQDGIGRDGIFLGFFRDFSGFFGITKYCFFLLIMPLSSTMMCGLAHLMCFDRSSESLNEYKHCRHLLFLTLLCTRLMCLERSPELLNEYKHCWHLCFLTLLCTHFMKIDGTMCLWSYIKKVSAKLKRNVHPKQQSGSRFRKKTRPNFGRDSGLIKTSVSVSVSGSRRALVARSPQWKTCNFDDKAHN
jgi:hypothetical protein